MTDNLKTTKEAAAITRAPESTLRYWRHLGIGPKSFKLGRRVVYRESDILAWIDEQANADAPPAV